jgi:hypothetical protein
MCCNERVVKPDGTIDGDCTPAVIWQDADDPKKWWAKVQHIPQPVPFEEDRFVHDPKNPTQLIQSPDGRAHACINASSLYVYCAVKGQPKG